MRARIAPLAAMIAETPQMEVPMASSEPSFPLRPNHLAAKRMMAPATVMSTRICTRLVPPSLRTSPSTNRAPSATIPIFSQNS
ncbi:Uncharacterised protein [Mycobacteroides abscessus subsp. abscessus]|nr:Uncharacterised protein [Mycobacteroides abscessus subsp. abscessus]